MRRSAHHPFSFSLCFRGVSQFYTRHLPFIIEYRSIRWISINQLIPYPPVETEGYNTGRAYGSSSGPGFRTGVGLGVGLCLGSICLAVCQYSSVSEFVLRGKTAGQILTVDLRSLLSFSLCLMVRSADHQPNARSAQTGVADQLMGRFADHDPTRWSTERTIFLG